ncbi:MAG: heparinase II/III family protein [Cyclobacteriaceae bacterium]
MKSKFIIIPIFCCLIAYQQGTSGTADHKPLPQPEPDPVKLENPISVSYIKNKLRKSGPKLVLTPAIEKQLKSKLKSDPMVKNYYAAMKFNADQIMKEPLLTRKMEGRRLLAVSREMLSRMSILGMIYRIEKNPAILRRIDDEVKAVCNFPDWNPSHYLDVAEMSLAIALAVDWAGEALPKATVDIAKTALIEKGIKPSYPASNSVPGWVNGTNNWNQVCNGGMIAASIVIADRDPALAAKTISRSLDGMSNALKQYGPDGLYPEGATYWGYGTSFSVMTSSLLESAFGTDFGIAAYPAFVQSADFRLLSVAPSGWYYNFADCGDKGGSSGDITLAWFAQQTGNPLYLEREKFLQNPEATGKLSRLAGAGLVWISQFEAKNETELPLAWKGEGENPVVIFRGGPDDKRQYYFGGKGGRATVSHGNMDAGSFIFELDGIRWVIDPGNQSYNEIEKTGFNLWANCQNCQRWQLLTKNNYGHSTLTVNEALHINSGFASLKDFKKGNQPEATFDLKEVFGGKLDGAIRRFSKENGHSILIEDKLQFNDSTKSITWQLMTAAAVEITKGGAILRQDGKQLRLENLSHPDVSVSVISLDPPPMELDRKIENLKRLELRLPAYLFPDNEGSIRVRLTADN